MKPPAIAKPDIIVPLNLFVVDCGICGCMDYKLKILPQGSIARLLQVSCSRCGNTMRVNNKAFIEGDGRVNLKKMKTLQPKPSGEER